MGKTREVAEEKVRATRPTARHRLHTPILVAACNEGLVDHLSPDDIPQGTCLSRIFGHPTAIALGLSEPEAFTAGRAVVKDALMSRRAQDARDFQAFAEQYPYAGAVA
ncbi:MAG TPA: hypothetical protein VMT23_03560 [Candidatus Binatia bacterium]|nr:hypothetical protein [Candidatus Binatia bacterium]